MGTSFRYLILRNIILFYVLAIAIATGVSFIVPDDGGKLAWDWFTIAPAPLYTAW